jgi:predicted metal-dependent peptidase
MPEAELLYAHRGTRAIHRMVEFAPSTGGLALWVKHQDLPAELSDTEVMTDGNTVFYGAAFEKLPLKLQVGLVAHEVLHIALRHPQRFVELQRLTGDVDLQLFNICADAIVNSTLAHLSWLQLPAGSVLLDQLLLQALSEKSDAEAALLQWDVERLYRSIDDRKQRDQNGQQQTSSQSQAGSKSNSGGKGGQDEAESASDRQRPNAREDGPKSAKVRQIGAKSLADLVPSPDAENTPEAEADEAREWSERILRGHAGDGAFSMLRTLIADLPRTKTPWAHLLRVQLARALSKTPDISWSRPTRSYIANQGRSGSHRLPFEPGTSPNKLSPRLAVIVDVSGSVEDPLLHRFSREIEAIARRQEAGLVLIVGDDRVRRVEIFEAGHPIDLGEIDFSGGGGTDFTPLLREADKHRPDIAVVLTDLEGPANFRPRWPVIWAVPESHAQAVHPFGRKLTLDW